MKRMAGSLEIPWPEPITDRGFVFPKDYRMNAFPRTPFGLPWYDTPDSEYFSWLAEYLPANLPQFNAEQHRLSMQLEHYDRLSGFWIGDRAGWYESEAAERPIHEFPDDFACIGNIDGVQIIQGRYTYADYAKWERGFIGPGGRIMTPEEFILEDFGWSLVQEREQREFAAYWPDFVKFDGFNFALSLSSFQHEPPDAGWRVYLGMVLQRIQGKVSRIKEIENFYYAWHDHIK